MVAKEQPLGQGKLSYKAMAARLQAATPAELEKAAALAAQAKQAAKQGRVKALYGVPRSAEQLAVAKAEQAVKRQRLTKFGGDWLGTTQAIANRMVPGNVTLSAALKEARELRRINLGSDHIDYAYGCFNEGGLLIRHANTALIMADRQRAELVMQGVDLVLEASAVAGRAGNDEEQIEFLDATLTLILKGGWPNRLREYTAEVVRMRPVLSSCTLRPYSETYR